jgi:hypothetical protein
MRTWTAVGLGSCLLAGSLLPAGCQPEGVGSINPPAGAARKDDSFLIPGFNPDAAAQLKKKSKAARAKAEPAPPEATRH